MTRLLESKFYVGSLKGTIEIGRIGNGWLQAQFRKANIGNGDVISSQVMGVKFYLLSVERKSKEALSQLLKKK